MKLLQSVLTVNDQEWRRVWDYKCDQFCPRRSLCRA